MNCYSNVKRQQILEGIAFFWWTFWASQEEPPCHQTRFLCSKYFKIALRLYRPRWGSLQHSPDPLAGFWGTPSWQGEEGMKEKVREGKGKEKTGKKGTESGGEWSPPEFISAYAPG